MEDTKSAKCMACAEEIKTEAKICKHCGTLQSDPRFLNSIPAPKTIATPKSSVTTSSKDLSDAEIRSLLGLVYFDRWVASGRPPLRLSRGQVTVHPDQSWTDEQAKSLLGEKNFLGWESAGRPVLKFDGANTLNDPKGSQLNRTKAWGKLVFGALITVVAIAVASTIGSGSVVPAASSSQTDLPQERQKTSSSTSVSIDPISAANFWREGLFESTGVQFLTGCPEKMSGTEGSVFTCYACPQDYAAVDFYDGKYVYYGDDSLLWRCDFAGEGLAVNYQVIDGLMILKNETTRAASK